MYVRTEIKVCIIIMGMLFQAAHKAERNILYLQTHSSAVFHCFERLLMPSDSLLDQSCLPR